MSLEPAQLSEIDLALGASSVDAQTIAALRRLTGLVVTRCDAIDMRDETPFRTYERCALYLIDGRDHCWRITQDPRYATGLALTAKGGGA